MDAKRVEEIECAFKRIHAECRPQLNHLFIGTKIGVMLIRRDSDPVVVGEDWCELDEQPDLTARRVAVAEYFEDPPK